MSTTTMNMTDKTRTSASPAMADVQNSPACVAVPIDRVGVKGLKLPIVVSDRARGRQHTVAMVDLAVDLPARFKGTHMSRFVEELENWDEEIGYASMRTLLERVKERLEAKEAYVSFRYPYFIRKAAPVSGMGGLMAYECRLTGKLADGKPVLSLEVTVPVMTVCPCSKAISCEGAHSQRAEVRIRLAMNGFLWLEDIIAVAEAAGSSPVYPVLKREDEKFVTEEAFANPMFVEDVVRSVATQLEKLDRIDSFRVDVESMESIHGHNAFARIERDMRGGHRADALR